MRIALVTETFYPATDGTTTTLKAVADRLVDTGHQVMVVAPGPGIGSYRGCPVVRIRPLEPVGAAGARRARRLPPRPRARHLPRRPGSQGAQAHPPERHPLSVVVEQGPALDVAADYWRAKVADRADAVLVTVVVDGRPDGRVRRRARGLWRPGVDTDAYTPALRDQWLYDSGPGPGRRTVPSRGRVRRRAAQAPRRTPAGRGWPRSRASGWSSSAAVRSATG